MGLGAGAAAIVVLAGVALFVFGPGGDGTPVADESPRARASSSASPGARNVDVAGKRGSSTKQGQDAQNKAGKNGKGKARGKDAHGKRRKAHGAKKHAAPRDSSAPKSHARVPPPKPNRYTPGQACGSGYGILESHPLYRRGARVATVYLLYSNAAGNNCAVTMRSDQQVGEKPVTVRAFLQRRGGHVESDSGSYLWYGGPVRLHAPGTCVRYGGSFGDGTTVSYTSPYGHCG